MIKFENLDVVGWNAAIRGMRNSWNSWEKSDSYDSVNYVFKEDFDDAKDLGLIGKNCVWDGAGAWKVDNGHCCTFVIGQADMQLMKKLVRAGSDHSKFLRMIVVYVDIIAPLYWWKEADTYKVGTVVNSCSTMHTVADKEFTLEDFSHEHLCEGSLNLLKKVVIDVLNTHRHYFKNFDNYKDDLLIDKQTVWWQIIQLLPTSYNQKRTVMLNYEVLRNIYKSRRGHKLQEWSDFCEWVEHLPYSELITEGVNNEI